MWVAGCGVSVSVTWSAVFVWQVVECLCGVSVSVTWSAVFVWVAGCGASVVSLCED